MWQQAIMQCVSMKCVTTSASQRCASGILIKSANCLPGGGESSYSITITTEAEVRVRY